MERKNKNQSNDYLVMPLLLLGLFLFLTISLIVKGCLPESTKPAKKPPVQSVTSTVPTEPQPTIDPNVPYVVSTASVGVTGDILAHGPVNDACLQNDGSYNYNECFQYIAPYYQQYDFMVANLEVTLGGPEAGPYLGYPKFNCPDAMIDALQWAGVDMLLTANNHSYDTGHNGFIRTQEVLREKGMLYNGTRLSTDEAKYIVHDINGIKIGMITYTFETDAAPNGNKTLNALTMDTEDCPLINSFNYSKAKMDQFYSEVEAAIAAMEDEGAQYIMFYIHWGNEYEHSPSNTQRKIAQKLCDRGVDIIVGGHPHVIQPMEVLTNNAGEKTYCIYSTGNAVSNQRRYELEEEAPEGHGEDGIIFGIEFELLSDGTTRISDLNVTPLWVSLDTLADGPAYTIIPVDVTYKTYPAITGFADAVNSVISPDRGKVAVDAFQVENSNEISNSYYRTMEVIQASLSQCRIDLGLPPLINTPGN